MKKPTGCLMKILVRSKKGVNISLDTGLSERQFFSQYLPVLNGTRPIVIPTNGGKVEILMPEDISSIRLSDLDNAELLPDNY